MIVLMGTINKEWHEKHRMPVPATIAQRVKWHEAHLTHCGCRKDVPPTIAAELKKQGKHVCSRGHVYEGSGSCPVCWPGSAKG